MEFTLNFNVDNAAFDGDPEFEIKRQLETVVYHVDHGRTSAGLYDVNGNRIGRFEIEI